MLVNMRTLLQAAQADNYCIGHFNTINLEMARAVIETAEELHAPVMVGIAETMLSTTPLELAAAYLLPMARAARVPVCVHFDHAHTFARCIQALRLGFTSIMYDCSQLDYQSNVAALAEMVRICHCVDVSVEGELGRVAGVEGASDAGGDAGVFTDPVITGDFAARTGVDALAVAIGNAHGEYTGTPKLDFPRLDAIAAHTPLPLVLHGGSGLSDGDFRAAIQHGIRKVNIYTDLNKAGKTGIETGLARGAKTLQQLSVCAAEEMRKVTAEKLTLFGSTERA